MKLIEFNRVYYIFFFVTKFLLENFCNIYSFLQGLDQKNVTLGFPSKINKLFI